MCVCAFSYQWLINVERHLVSIIKKKYKKIPIRIEGCKIKKASCSLQGLLLLLLFYFLKMSFSLSRGQFRSKWAYIIPARHSFPTRLTL